MKGTRKSGFSLIELIIVIVILAVISAIALPRISRGAKGANESAVGQNLALIRSAIETYAAEHDGTFPGTDEATFVSGLTKFSDKAGATSDTKDSATGKIYGPYLLKIPPLTVGANAGKNTVTVGNTGPAAGGTTGWVYNYKSGQLIANCADTELAENGTKFNTW
ncbi:MAG: prepilin-type N-terminal cleavage/methylation domain-containing protein [Planctomycetes bacterium]|nr:prepilin-type N-terminal cleavage/methylation domain-containing protein [Planctomycetota bacterium]